MTSPVQPLPQQYPVLAIPTAIDYTSKDWTALRASMLAYAAQAFPQWNTNSEGDFGVMMVELMAYMGDILSYYGDRISQEAYLGTATQRLSLLNIARTLGYIPANGAPASGTVTFETEATGPAATIPSLTQVSTNFPVGTTGAPAIYETQAAVVCPANGGTVTAEVVQGITETMVQIGTSDGTPGQAFAIPQTGVIDGTVTVFVEDATDSGTTQWTQVSFLVDAGGDEQAFATTTDQNGDTIVGFGDNQNGVIPAVGLSIFASYRIGVGAAGNVPAGSVTIIATPVDGVSIALLADGVTYDSSAMTGGADPESNDQIRANAPAAYRAQYRAIGLQDYSDLALNVPGVLMATAVANHSTSVALYILGPNYTAPGPNLIDNILSYFAGPPEKNASGVTVSVVAPGIIPVDIGSAGAPVQVNAISTYSTAVVEQNVTAALQAFLSPPNISFGQLINLSDIYGVIREVAGVNYCIIPVFTREDQVQTGTASIQLRPTEVPSIGNIYLSMSGGLT